MTARSVGVSWIAAAGGYGPDGVAGGNQCFFKWFMNGPGAPSIGVDTARLRVDVLLSSVILR